MVNSIIHSATVSELDDALTLPLVVNVGVSDLAGGAEVVFQVLKETKAFEITIKHD